MDCSLVLGKYAMDADVVYTANSDKIWDLSWLMENPISVYT